MSATTLNATSSTDETQTQSLPTIWQVIVGSLAGVTLIAFVVYLVTAINFLNRPFIGAMLTQSMVVNAGQATGETDWPAFDAGLRRNDQVIAINGESLFATEARRDYAAAYTNFNRIMSNTTEASTVDLTVLFEGSASERSGSGVQSCSDGADGFATCVITISPLARFPNTDFLAYFLMPYLGGIVLIVLGLMIIRHKFDSTDGVMAVAIAFSSAIYSGGIFDVGTQSVLAPLWYLGASAIGSSLVIFGINFPRRLRELRNMPYLDYIVLAIFGAVGAWLIYGFYYPQDAWSQVALYTPIATAITSVGIVTLWATSVLQRRRATNPITRDQANSMFIGTTLMLIPVAVWLLTRGVEINGQPAIPFNLEAIVILTNFPVAAIAYAVLQYRTLDTEYMTRRGITYGIMAGALVLSMYLITLGGSLLAIDIFNASNNAIIIAVILFLMVIFFLPMRNFLQARIDKIYYREQHELQKRVQEYNRNLTSITDYDEIVTFTYNALKSVLVPHNIYIFLSDRTNSDYSAYEVNGTRTDIRFTADSPLIRVLLREESNLLVVGSNEQWPHEVRIEQPRLNLLKAQVLAGLPSDNRLNGFVMLTAPINQRDYQYDQIMYFTDVVNQFAIATERSQVISTLERRVQELDVLSQVGQAVNFTIELDDLLELIYNQTSKLLPVPNFYIVLYEENINRLYFAFYLEGDDRVSEKENVRWMMGLDLFSEIVKRNTSIRTNNFTAEMKKRSAEFDMIDSGLLSWMGVPLAAGRGILGVMAAGKRRDTVPYTDEQFKIFSDVAALAATSLDKANLFNQTRIRQRQLTVLNDISRQLVATETDVEKLLSIIMQSAVEILNAEAGSLLLNAEDDSGDLIFRVVIGGGGDDLLQTRIPAGQGVVGRVVASNESIIVNDAESDPRHMIEVTKDFISRSLLAVPLTAKDEVIGVLEVINKRDGTPFVMEDANLLTTFASQAAVAIENARLFQQTDQQLSQRVKELETLERMDAQLNRTLALSEVAEITVNQAMDILGANAGALGIVHENPPYLEIVSIKGYTYDEYPPDAEGEDRRIWSLNSGVVKRVMRSRQADITMDVSMDPDYEYGLANSNSQITLPMISGDAINAILILEKNSLPRFSLPDWAFAQRIADHASVAIANAQFYLALNNAMKSKSEFMGFAAHELKNPLASVKGYAEVMLSGMTGDLSEQQENFLSIIKNNAERMKTLIDDLRDSAMIDNNEFRVEAEPMNVRNAVVETLRPFVNLLAEKNQDLVNNVPEDLPLIWGDETRVIQVLTNLVSNAHKYSYENTTIEVGGELREEYVDRQGNRRGRMVVIWIKDQGIGMSEEDQSKLFKERYFRSTNDEAKSMATGTGLGMTLTYNIMIQHKGEIWIESAKGEGSTFFISFPLADEIKMALEKIELAGD
ncbi:MAG: GAF domain-containing protein [Anaerolineae bacterium]